MDIERPESTVGTGTCLNAEDIRSALLDWMRTRPEIFGENIARDQVAFRTVRNQSGKKLTAQTEIKKGAKVFYHFSQNDIQEIVQSRYDDGDVRLGDIRLVPEKNAFDVRNETWLKIEIPLYEPSNTNGFRPAATSGPQPR